ncbi:MAG: PaaI family thioesterase [Nevskiaceae bacterium]|nr:MAG: PaaI family thioesterase [Nevskiaceae bacterium]
MNPQAAAILAAIESHPLHRFMGVDKIDAGDGIATIEIVVSEATVNARGAFHGGVAYTLCDMACYAALIGQLAEGENAATHDLHVSLLRAAQHGDRIVTTGRVIKRGRNVAFMEAAMHCKGELLARATVTKSILRPRGAAA